MQTSLVKTVGNIDLPKYEGDNIIYMEEIDFANPQYKDDRWNQIVVDLVSRTGVTEGKGYFTVDEKRVHEGEAHRRGGRHIDGNYTDVKAWANPETPTWTKPPSETPEPKWVSPSPSRWSMNTLENGGILLVSNAVGSQAWEGSFEGEYGEGGSCEHINVSGMDRFKLKENVVYLGNHFIHESIPVEKTVDRTLVRLTLPYVA
jgi:hypothetical protein